MTGRIRSQIKVAEMGFLRRETGVTLGDKVRSSVIHEKLGVEPLLFCVGRSQLSWWGCLVRMPPGCLPMEVFTHFQQGGVPGADPDPGRCHLSDVAKEKGSLGSPAETAASTTQPWIRG